MTGVFYTPLQFRAFPFDTQLLVVQVGVCERERGAGKGGGGACLAVTLRALASRCAPHTLASQIEYANKFNYSNIIIQPSATSTQLYEPHVRAH